MSEGFIALTDVCHCVEDDEPNKYCPYCDGKGEVLTEDGRKLIKFMREYLFS